MSEKIVSDERLEVLRDAYDHVSRNRDIRDAIALRDAENLSIITELQHCRSRYCPKCGGFGWVENPDARYTMDYVEHIPTGVYSTIDEEEIDCPECNGVGFIRPIPNRYTVNRRIIPYE